MVEPQPPKRSMSGQDWSNATSYRIAVKESWQHSWRWWLSGAVVGLGPALVLLVAWFAGLLWLHAVIADYVWCWGFSHLFFCWQETLFFVLGVIGGLAGWILLSNFVALRLEARVNYHFVSQFIDDEAFLQEFRRQGCTYNAYKRCLVGE